eukprot:1758758-Prymnesium_polylepis.1
MYDLMYNRGAPPPKRELAGRRRRLARSAGVTRVSSMRLLVLRSSWGLAGLGRDAARAIAGVRAAGFDGIEMSLAEYKECSDDEQRALRGALRSHDMSLIMSAYSSWDNYVGAFDGRSTVQDHTHTMTQQLREIAEVASAVGPGALRVNGHSGSDAWTEAEACEFFEATTEAASTLGDALPPLSHETHRGRYLCCPFATARLLRRVPTLRLTSDFSHWVVKCERLLDSPEEAALLHGDIAPAVDHLHARIGTPQSPQVADVRSPLAAGAAERFYSFWESVWGAHEQASVSSRSSVLTATIEYGPVERCEASGDYAGYTPVGPSAEPVAPHAFDETLERAAADLRERFDAWHSDAPKRRFPF